MGGKGGVGKTSVMTGLAEWFDANEIPVTLLDLDTENKARGSLGHFFGERAPKVSIHTPAGLDTFVDHLADGEPVILADMGAGSGAHIGENHRLPIGKMIDECIRDLREYRMLTFGARSPKK